MSKQKTAEPDEPIAMTPPGIDPNKMMLADIDTTSGPSLSVKEVADFFFNRSEHWLRLQEGEGRLYLGKQEVVIRRSESNARQYSLGDIERIAHALAQHDVIGGPHAVHVVQAVVALARIHGFLDGNVVEGV